MNENKKIKILAISDNMLAPSGVGTQTNLIFSNLLKTGKFSVVQLGGAIKHHSYNPIKTEEYGDDLIIYPVDGYGTMDQIRSVIRNHRPDMCWIMTDPRFFYHIFGSDNEIRNLMPLVYYHVFDNFPYPSYNKKWYLSCDHIVSISKLTDNIVRNVAPDVPCSYIPHTVNSDIFKKLDDNVVVKFRQENFPFAQGKTMFFWSNRNAGRKNAQTLLYAFKEFLDNVGHDKAFLLLHTDPKDQHGSDLAFILKELGLDQDKKVLISDEKIPPQSLALLYNAADCTVNISNAEGFGLATFESLCCGTPIIATMTGGLQEQLQYFEDISEDIVRERNRATERVIECENGIGIIPAASQVIGSQEIPMIWADHPAQQDVVKALEKMHNMSIMERNEMGERGRKHCEQHYNFSNLMKSWEELFLELHEKHGSWETRKYNKRYEMIEL